jgi:hypothetical protein
MTTPSPETTNTPTDTTATTPPAPGTPAHDAALAATFENRDKAAAENRQPETPKAEKPAGLPDAFWDAEKGEVNAAAFEALNKPADKADEPAPKTDAEKAAEAAKSEPVKAFEAVTAEGTKALTEVGLDYAKYAESYQKNGGKLTDADYAEMASKNIPKAVVDAHIAGLVAHANAEAATIQASVYSVVGGEAKYGEMVTWAKANVPAGDLAAFDKVIDTGSIDAVKMAVENLYGKMVAATGSEPRLVNGSGPAVNDAFESTAQLTDAMKDPRYRADPAYRKAVEAKLARSNIM